MILVPIGHGEGSVRRLPWVTFALMAACLAVHLARTFASGPAAPEPLEVSISDAWERWEAHTYLEIDSRLLDAVGAPADPARRESLVATIRSQRYRPPPADPAVLAEEQAALDRLTAQALGDPASEAAEPAFARYGLTPAHPAPIAWLSHLFLHAGWLHLAGNLFLLFLAAPALEDRWGRALFLGLYLASGLAGAAAHVALTQHPDLPLVGASGAIAGAMGAFLVRYVGTQIKFFYLFFFGLYPRTGTFEAPAWLMLPLWFASQLVSGALGMEGGVAVWAHAGGFAFGAAFALALRAAKLEERVVAPRLARAIGGPGNAALASALEARARGDLAQAKRVLEEALRARPYDADVGLALFDLAVERDETASAAPALLALVKRLAARGDGRGAAACWRALAEHAPSQRAEGRALLEIATALRADGDPAAAALALRHASESTALGPALAARVATEAREIDPRTALQAAHRALGFAELPAPKRASLQALVASLGHAPASAADPPWLVPEAAPSVAKSRSKTVPPAAQVAAAACEAVDARAVDFAAPDDEAEAGAPLELGDTPYTSEGADEPEHAAATIARDGAEEQPFDFGASIAAALPRFAKLEVTEATARRLREREIALSLLGSDRAVTLALSKIEALALVEIAGPGAPSLVLDLALSWSALADGGTLRVVRLRGAAEGGGSAKPSALHLLAEEIVQRSGAALLTPGVREGDTPRFESLGQYERDVLLVEA